MGKDPASLAMVEEKIRHIETQAENFANQAAAIQATLATLGELSPEDANAMDQLTQDQQAIVAAVGLASDQLQAVCSAVATQQQPIVGVRYTKPSNGDTYDLCQAAFDKLPPEEQEQFEAVPTPDINFLIRNVAATEEAVPPEATCEPEPEPDPATVTDDAEGDSAGSGSEFELVDGDESSEEAE